MDAISYMEIRFTLRQKRKNDKVKGKERQREKMKIMAEDG